MIVHKRPFHDMTSASALVIRFFNVAPDERGSSSSKRQ
jgi:hypothetical protein